MGDLTFVVLTLLLLFLSLGFIRLCENMLKER
jgi:hypothetical protein